MTGLVHLYTGDGKGKTTAAIGLAVRAAGRGQRVVIAQFLKGRDSGELHGLALLSHVTIFRLGHDYGFVRFMDATTLAEVKAEHETILQRVADTLRTGHCDLLVLDEIAAASRHGLVDTERLVALIDHRPDHVEIVMTGRDAPGCLIERSDYITEMRKIAHPFDHGVAARKGIEW